MMPSTACPTFDHEGEPARRSDAFFSAYEWCLNPVLRLEDILQRIREEVDRYHALVEPWQAEESRINLYLLLCAACCATDDYLAWRPWNLERVARAFGRFRPAIVLAESVLNAPHGLRKALVSGRILRWRRACARSIDLICAILAGESAHADAAWTAFESAVKRLGSAALPAALLAWRMRIPEGFRCQDLAHQDVLAMVDRFLESEPPGAGPVVVVGPRTAGAYFAPLVVARLKARGVPTAGWLTIRPKQGISAAERRQLRRLLSGAKRVVVVDDHPNSGNTLALVGAALRRLGADPATIVFLAPEHPAQPDWKKAVRPLSTITLPCAGFYKQRLLENDNAMLSRLRAFYREHGWEQVELEAGAELVAQNSRLSAHYADGFQVRLKRVLEVRLSAAGRPSIVKRVFAKSVGWGWLGYHAYIAGVRLARSVPPVIGLRDGILFTEWIGYPDGGGQRPDAEQILEALPAYLARRVDRLRLREDPCFAAAGYRWTGWDTLVQTLRRAYGPYIGELKTGAIRGRLKKYVTPMPALLDGRMELDDWVSDGTGLYKADFEQHNFGGGEQDLVDTAYDLASAIFKFDLQERDERTLVDRYIQASGDIAVRQRLPLYKIFCGVLAVKTAAYRLAREAPRERLEIWNGRYFDALNFLTYQMNRYNAARLCVSPPAAWTRRLIFVDLDGVVDWDRLGFPHTTPSGLLALHTLKAGGYSIVLNTGRSIGHVRNYCRAYDLPGGVGEYGSVFFDAVGEAEIPLIDGVAREQLRECRRRVEELPGVFTDPGYEYAVRAYRFKGHLTIGLRGSEAEELLEKFQCDRVGVLSRLSDTTFVQKGVNKGAALEAVKRYAGVSQEAVAAMGDSAPDLEMLEQADIAYMPANRAKALRQIERRPGGRVMARRLQRGFLAAAQNLIRSQGGKAIALDGVLGDGANDLIDALLRACERSPLGRALRF
jgi:hydroxymethylpyrimidine pyrophosphatase-like HAD family hydrolase/adenine/guanine phosphoribosyltransferase-like PRPP-binding protein